MNENAPMKDLLRDIYYGDSARGARFRFALLAFDVVTIIFFILATMLEPGMLLYAIDAAIGLVLLADLTARLCLADWRPRWLLGFDVIADILVILSLLAAFLVDNLAFLRVLRMLRLLRSHRVVRDLQSVSPWFREHQEVIQSSLNLLLFIFVIAAIVFVVENDVNPEIRNYLDALYFTVTTLTTTGFGDITMADAPGRFLSIIIMVVGVSLFLNLIRTIFRPSKIRFTCPDCGLLRHDADAVHCKHCGRVLNIPSEGF